MTTSSFSVLVVLLILGTVAIQAAVTGGEYIVKGRIPVKNPGVVKGQYPAQDQDMVKGQDPVKDQDPVKGQDPIKGQKPGSCPMIMIRCAMYNPPNRCESDSECSGAKKCCEGSCGKVCMDPK